MQKVQLISHFKKHIQEIISKTPFYFLLEKADPGDFFRKEHLISCWQNLINEIFFSGSSSTKSLAIEGLEIQLLPKALRYRVHSQGLVGTACKIGLKTQYIEPICPRESGYMESINGKRARETRGRLTATGN
jgi:hypothetical protein